MSFDCWQKKKCFDLWQQLVRAVLELSVYLCLYGSVFWVFFCTVLSGAFTLFFIFYGDLDFVIVYVEMSTILRMKHRIATFKVLILSTIVN
jgi:hypothetical protein